MINELIEKEIEKIDGEIYFKQLGYDDLRKFGQTIAKEVAMMLKFDEKEYPENGLCPCAYQTNEKADQIINEVSE